MFSILFLSCLLIVSCQEQQQQPSDNTQPQPTTVTTTPHVLEHQAEIVDTTYSRLRKMYKSMYLLDTSYADFSTIRPEMSSPGSAGMGYIYSFRGLILGISNEKDLIGDCSEAILVKEDGSYDFSKIGQNVIGEFFAEAKLYKNSQKDANIKEWFDIISEGCDAPQKMSEFLTLNPEYQGSPLGIYNYHLSLYSSDGYKDRTQIHLEGMYSIQPPVNENTKHKKSMEFACTSASDIHSSNSQAAYDLDFVGHLMQSQTQGPSKTVGSIHRLVAPYAIIAYPKTVQKRGQLLDGIDI